jgi:glycosyltransferase involved in cell wall biosynthesis
VTDGAGRIVRPRALVILDVAPDPASWDGTSQRYAGFLARLCERADVRIVYIHRPNPRDDPCGDWEARFPATVVLDSSRPLLLRPTIIGRIGRLVHFLADPLPLASQPRMGRLINRIAAELRPDVAVVVQWRLAHLALRIPGGIPTLAILEEPPERFPDQYLYASDSVFRRLVRTAERIKVRRLYRRLGARVKHIVAVSAYEARWFSARVPPCIVSTVPPGIDLDFYRPEGPQVDEEIDVLVTGDLSEWRNSEGAAAVFDAFQHLPDRPIGTRWTFAGWNPAARIRALASEEHVRVPGFVPDLRSFYRRARVVLVPAFAATGVKTTLLQAWGMRKPVVAATASTTGVDARPGDNLLDGQNPEDLARHVLHLLNDPRQGERLGDAGRRTVCAGHDLAKTSQSLADLVLETADP